MSDWMQLASSLAASLAWPLVGLIALLVLRKPLVGLLGRVRDLEGLGLKARLDRDLVDAELSSERLVVPPVDPEDALRSRTVGDPIGTIVRSWIAVEAALVRFARADGHGEERPVLMKIAETLYREGRIDRATLETYEKLRRIRNSAVHAASSFEPTEGQAASFAELANEVIRAIDFQSDYIRAHGRGEDEK